VIAERSAFIRERFALPVRTIEPVGDGWDSDTYEVDRGWIVRFPRRPQVELRMRGEIELLDVLQRRLTASVPRPELVSLDPLCVGYRKLEGRPLTTPVARELGGDVARFLSELHQVPIDAAHLARGDWRTDLHDLLAEFGRDVVPLLSGAERRRAQAMFADYLADESSFTFKPAIVHADLGPEHLLTDGERLTGVIDWSDATVGDPAIDFAWLLNGSGEAFAYELAEQLPERLDESTRRRALFFHQLGPWHEVTYGRSLGDDSFVRSGLQGVRERLSCT
jgi:aminoglycoside phosphotransferase (APT) family kinase protein